MAFRLKPDYEQIKARFAAFWQREIIDRPPVSIVLPKENPQPLPQKTYPNLEAQWLDIDFRTETMARKLENTEYYADSLPIAWPNLGPEIFSAWCGCGYQFGERTAWSEPCIKNWDEDADKATFNPEHPLFKFMVRFTERLIELGRGNFIVGLTDFHPGGDHLAALRGPQNFAMDLLENLQAVKDKLASSYQEYFQVYDYFYNRLRAAGMPITFWTPIIHEGRCYIPSNDFSCMISKSMFDEVFLPGIIGECQFYERAIYHLDGPGALRHLDSLLEIKELHAIQWVPGAGNEGYSKWVYVYQKIQKANKAIQLCNITTDDLPIVFETLKPEGVWFSSIAGIKTRSEADAVIKRISQWR